jgi:hypothetical protein
MQRSAAERPSFIRCRRPTSGIDVGVALHRALEPQHPNRAATRRGFANRAGDQRRTFARIAQRSLHGRSPGSRRAVVGELCEAVLRRRENLGAAIVACALCLSDLGDQGDEVVEHAVERAEQAHAPECGRDEKSARA